jgi:hypothetical protein
MHSFLLGSPARRQSKVVSADINVSRVSAVNQFLDELHQRFSRVEIFLSRRRRFKSVDEFGAGVEAKQQFFIRKVGTTILFSDLFQ